MSRMHEQIIRHATMPVRFGRFAHANWLAREASLEERRRAIAGPRGPSLTTALACNRYMHTAIGEPGNGFVRVVDRFGVEVCRGRARDVWAWLRPRADVWPQVEE